MAATPPPSRPDAAPPTSTVGAPNPVAVSPPTAPVPRPRNQHYLGLRAYRKIQNTLGVAVTAAILILLAALFVTSVAMYFAERGSNPDVHTFRQAMAWVFFEMVGGPAAETTTTTGRVLKYVVDLLKPISIAVITAAITSHLFNLIVRRGTGMGRTRMRDHIVICGWSSKAAEILKEIRGRDDGGSRTPVVVLAPLAESPTKDELTTFVSGDPSAAGDLKRAGIDRARTAVVLADNSYPDIDVEEMDSRTLLTTLAIEALNPNCYTIVEVVHSENRDHFNRTKADELVVSAHLTGALLAHSAVARGLSKVVDDLLTYPEGDEFYWTDVPAGWAGQRFYEAMSMLKLKYDAVPLAVARDGSYVVNPAADYELKSGDRFLLIAKTEPKLT